MLDERCIRVVWAELAEWRRELSVLANTLADEERERAGRFRIAADRERFVVGRGLLRRLLGEALAIDPRQVRLVAEPSGRPRLDASTVVDFNVSHAHELIGITVAIHRRVGLDVEWLGRRTDAVRLAKRFFPAQEAAALERLPESERPAAFLRSWTEKEAYVKALGRGIGAVLVPQGNERGAWTVVRLDCPQSYTASLCTEAGDWHTEAMVLRP